ncbi:MCE family protein [Nocardioides sp. DS6]|uniref:MCE family protein n=1 Tax=Nocardioides eburneus TaxID=3231482 RepID=A0ABV3SXX6_9ACTN
MKLLDKKTTSDLWKVVVFAVVTTLATGLLVITIGNVSFGSSKDYKALFSDATGVNPGDDVRIAGVKVGTVKKIEIEDSRALVTFSVDAGERLAAKTHATIRYRNLVGQRYVALTDEMSEGAALHPGQTIPIGQTTPALDLTVLFNGFKPLFQALSPNDINTLSYEIVQVFQGEGGTLDSLLAHTASLTGTLADRDQVINQLIDNLNQVLAHVGKRDKQLSSLIVTFRKFVHGLAGDRNAILGSLDQISDLSVQAADLVNGIRNPFVEDIKQLKTFAGQVNDDKAQLDKELQIEPIKLNKIGGTATYGSWFNFYLCGVKGNVILPGGSKLPVNYNVGSARCHLG